MLLQEELAEGLHMIDFEQLKIDNVNLNEKIEERNEVISNYTHAHVLTTPHDTGYHQTEEENN